MIQIDVSPEALSDLEEIKSYIEGELLNPDAARNTLERLTSAMRGLCESPDRGAPLSARISQETDYRYLVSGNYIIFYRREGVKTVRVIRVLYGRRDYIRILLG